MSWDNVKPPAPTDGWGTPPKPVNTQSQPALDAWGVHPDQTSPMTLGPEQFFVEELREALWTTNALDSANVKAGVVNALAGTKDAFNIDQDGELTRMNEIASTQKGPHGYYIAYHNGCWLHAILSGPYETEYEARSKSDRAYDMFINDAAFKIAFENNFNKAGIYRAQIPLSAKRKGAYGVLS